ncbi:hypothetical protein FACS189481_4300 [Clostridia bacterium]|nr:hypothetical protein FACS189481_4300 [Clostridia bacterium]
MGKKIFRGMKVTVLTISVVVSAITGILTTYYFLREPEFVNFIHAFHGRKDEISRDLSEPAFVDFMLTFREMKDKISTDYLGKMPPDNELYVGAYQGMVSAIGDPYSYVVSKKQNEERGLTVLKKKMFGILGNLYVFTDGKAPGNYFFELGYIVAGSQLEKAGFKSGDVIIGVNSFVVEAAATQAELENPKITKITQTESDLNYLLLGLGDVLLIGGETEQVIWHDSVLQTLDKVKPISPEQKKESQNKNVLLTVQRYNAKTGAKERFSASVAKETFHVDSAYSRLMDDGIGYIRLRDFNLGASNVFFANLNDVLKRGAKSLVIDLRFNLGGILGECNKVIDMFIKKGEICKLVRKNSQQTFSVTKNTAKTDIPIVVLVNEKSVSCPEIFAAVMQAHKRGIVIGTKTWGKGVSQDICPFAHDEVTLWITAQEWVAMPGDVSINKVGVTPDLEVAGPYLNSPEFGNPKQDSQLSAAIKHLKEKTSKNLLPEWQKKQN